jgi:hypothetical protein
VATGQVPLTGLSPARNANEHRCTPTTGLLDRFAEPRPSAEPNWKNNFRVARDPPGIGIRRASPSHDTASEKFNLPGLATTEKLTGGIATASRKARRCAHGSTAWLRTPASKVCLWCGSQHRPKHFNEGTYTVVTDCDSDLRDRFLLCQHLKGSKQPRLLSPTAK